MPQLYSRLNPLEKCMDWLKKTDCAAIFLLAVVITISCLLHSFLVLVVSIFEVCAKSELMNLLLIILENLLIIRRSLWECTQSSFSLPFGKEHFFTHIIICIPQREVSFVFVLSSFAVTFYERFSLKPHILLCSERNLNCRYFSALFIAVMEFILLLLIRCAFFRIILLADGSKISAN